MVTIAATATGNIVIGKLYLGGQLMWIGDMGDGITRGDRSGITNIKHNPIIANIYNFQI